MNVTRKILISLIATIPLVATARNQTTESYGVANMLSFAPKATIESVQRQWVKDDPADVALREHLNAKPAPVRPAMPVAESNAPIPVAAPVNEAPMAFDSFAPPPGRIPFSMIDPAPQGSVEEPTAPTSFSASSVLLQSATGADPRGSDSPKPTRASDRLLAAIPGANDRRVVQGLVLDAKDASRDITLQISMQSAQRGSTRNAMQIADAAVPEGKSARDRDWETRNLTRHQDRNAPQPSSGHTKEAHASGDILSRDFFQNSGSILRK